MDSVNMFLHNYTYFLLLLPTYCSFWYISIDTLLEILAPVKSKGILPLTSPELMF